MTDDADDPTPGDESDEMPATATVGFEPPPPEDAASWGVAVFPGPPRSWEGAVAHAPEAGHMNTFTSGQWWPYLGRLGEALADRGALGPGPWAATSKHRTRVGVGVAAYTWSYMAGARRAWAWTWH